MSANHATTSTDSATPSRRGQTLVEFALVLPMLLVLLLGIADFGRIFAAGITIEAASRDAAEIVALEYERNRPPSADPAAYAALHTMAAQAVCAESRQLPNTTYSGGACPTVPVVRVCIHDNVDPQCGQPIAGFADPPPSGECDAVTGMTNVRDGDANDPNYVEVRVCYHFTTLFNLHLALPMDTGLNIGDIYLNRDATFTVPCWTPTDTPC